MRKSVFILVFALLFLPFVLAETTFEDNPDDFFIMADVVQPTPVVTPVEVGGGGGGITRLVPECVNDSDCELEEFCFENKCYVYDCDSDADCNDTKTCWMNRCVKLFDMKIIDVQSPIYPGDFFEFTYYLKGVAAIHGDVIVNFWLVKDGEVVTEGFDTIYIGDFDEKTESTELFLPASILPGIYNFYLEVNYDSYYARAGRIIEVTAIVEEGEGGVFLTGQAIAQIQEGLKSAIIPILIFIALVILGIIIYWERRKIKKSLIQEEKWIKKHRLSVATGLLFIVVVILMYFLNKAQIISFPSIKDSFSSFFLGMNLIFKRFIIPNIWYVLGMIFLIIVILLRKKIKKYVKPVLVKIIQAKHLINKLEVGNIFPQKSIRKIKRFYQNKKDKISKYFEAQRHERELRDREKAREQSREDARKQVILRAREIAKAREIIKAKQLAKKPSVWITFPKKSIRKINRFYQNKKDKISKYFEARRHEKELFNRKQKIIMAKELAVKPKIVWMAFPKKIIRKIKKYYKKKQENLSKYFEAKRYEQKLQSRGLIKAKQLAKKPSVWMTFPQKITRKIKRFYQKQQEGLYNYFEARRHERELRDREQALNKMREFVAEPKRWNSPFKKGIKKIQRFYQNKKDKISKYFEARRHKKKLRDEKKVPTKVKDFFSGSETKFNVMSPKPSNIFVEFKLNKENVIAKAKELLSEETVNLFLEKNILENINEETYQKINALNEQLEKLHSAKKRILENNQLSDILDGKAKREIERAEREIRKLEGRYKKIFL